MKIYQQFLAASVDEPCPSMNASAQKMLQSLTAAIKTNRSSRRNGTLIHEVVATAYHLPKAVNVEKTKTKWEKFAETKGIKQRKKSSLVYSEEAKKWLPTWGGKSLQNQKLQSGVVEVAQSLSKLKKEKIARIAKNKKNREANRKKINM